MGTPNRKPQEYSGNTIEYKDPGRYIPILFLLCSWVPCLGFPVKSLLKKEAESIGLEFSLR